MYKPKFLRFLWKKFKSHFFSEVFDEFKLIERRISKCESAIDTNNSIRFYELYRRQDESILDAKKRFFNSLETTDDFILLKQKGNYILLKNFIDICNKNNLTYWITYGTLLGAIRHKGFVPWDDDVDVAMPINDLEKLKKILKNNKKFCVKYICGPAGSIFLPRFIFKNHCNLWMVDIYPRVPVKGDLDKAEKYYLQLQNELLNDFKKSKENLLFDWLMYEREIPNNIMNIYTTALNTKKTVLYDALNSISTNNNIIGYVYDIGHPINESRCHNYELIGDIFPLSELKFKDINVKCPKNYLKRLDEFYGDIYSLPNDILTHIHTLKDESINIEEELNYLKNHN